MNCVCWDHSGPERSDFMLILCLLWKNRTHECLLTQAQGLKCSHKLFHLFSFYLKSNAENQILQGHTNQKETKKKETFTEGVTFHLHPSEPAIEPSTHSRTACVFVWTLQPRCRPSHSHSCLQNQLLCFRKLFFFLHFSENLNIFSLLKITRKTKQNFK